MMVAGLASSSLYKTNPNVNTSGGIKKQGLPAFDGLIANRTFVVTKAEGRTRNVVFTLNQMGGVSSSSFSSSAHVYAVGGGVHKPVLRRPVLGRNILGRPILGGSGRPILGGNLGRKDYE